jgi:NADP-dependent 3-hydroxy acid dehydrogenase YdfG
MCSLTLVPRTDIAAAIAAAKKHWGRFDIMVNNAGA